MTNSPLPSLPLHISIKDQPLPERSISNGAPVVAEPTPTLPTPDVEGLGFTMTGGMADAELVAGKFIQRVCPGLTVQLAYQNNVSAPQPPFCLVQGIDQYRSMLNVDEWDEAGENLTRGQLATFTVQAAFFGKDAHAQAAGVTTLWRSDIGPALMESIRPNWAPLYAQNRRFRAHVNESGNWQERWHVTLKMNGWVFVTSADPLAESIDLNLRPLRS